MDEAKGGDLEKKMRLREEEGNNESSIHLLRKRLPTSVVTQVLEKSENYLSFLGFSFLLSLSPASYFMSHMHIKKTIVLAMRM